MAGALSSAPEVMVSARGVSGAPRATGAVPRWDAQWLNAQYNNRARVPESAQILARWAQDSAVVRRDLPCHLDVRYGSGAAERLDVFSSHAPLGRKSPVVFFIHGGWWRALDKFDHSWIAPHFCAQGSVVVVPNYALCPGVGIDAIALQMAQALAWCVRHIDAYGGDPQRLVVVGHSAGGHLAAMMLCANGRKLGSDLPATLVRQAVSISGVFDLEPLRQTPFLAPDLRLTPALVRRLSPAGFKPPAQGRLWALAGADESEEFLRHNRLIRSRWGKRAVPACDTVAGCNHFTVLDDLAQPKGMLHGLVRGLLAT